MPQVADHRLVVLRRLMADVHQLQYVFYVGAAGEESLDHAAPLFLFLLRSAREAVARQIRKQKRRVDFIEVDEPGLARLARCARQLSVAGHPVNQGGLAHVALARQRDFRQALFLEGPEAVQRCYKPGPPNNQHNLPLCRLLTMPNTSTASR